MTDHPISRCAHGNIPLGCPNDECAEQNEYLAEQQRALDAWDERMTEEARQMVHRALGLPR